MSIQDGALSTASDPETSPPYDATQVALADWPQDEKRAWNAIHSTEVGDTVVWGTRVAPLEVTKKVTRDDGTHLVTVRGPRGGTYTIRERYHDNGRPKFYADDSKANDLRIVESVSEDSDRPFTEPMYRNLVENLKRTSITEYAEHDYANYYDAVSDVVNAWVSDVEFQRWRGWPYDWEDDDPEYIYMMIREHSGRFPEVEDPDTGSVTPKAQARDILITVVQAEGQQIASTQLISSEEDFREVVNSLAEDAIEEYDLKAHLDPRTAALQVTENFIEAHTEPAHRAIIRYGDDEFIEFELYDNLSPEEVTREMALDVLDAHVWERTRDLHQERGTHDPTIRGLAFWEYDQLVEALTEEALREHSLDPSLLLYTTARTVVRDFADNVENHIWPYDFGGVSTETWGAGDTEDIFTSVVMHAEVDPVIFNPFARDKERRMATQVLSEVVHNRASNALDRKELQNAQPIPADEYLEEQMGLDMTFNDIRTDAGATPEDFIREAMTALGEREDIDHLAGWTFVDELVTEGEAKVPFVSGPWVLVDFGLVRRDDLQRRIAWFNRDSGAVLQLIGTTTGTPEDGAYGFNDDFNVLNIEWRQNEPNYLVSDASLQYALRFAKEYMRSDESDIEVIETPDGERYIKNAITEDDFDSRAFTSISPGFSMPGPDFAFEDVVTYGSNTLRNLSNWLRANSRIIDTLSTTAVGLFLGEVSYLMYRFAPGLNLEPSFDKEKGVGIQGSYSFGAEGSAREYYNPDDPDADFYTGEVKSDIYITPGTFKFLGDIVTPDWLWTAGPDTETVVRRLERLVTQPLRSAAGGDLGRPAAIFRAAHLPPNPEGRPPDTDKYDERTPVSIYDDARVFHYSLEEKPNYGASSKEGVTHLARSELLERLEKITLYGYEVETGGNGYRWEGDESVKDLLNRRDYDYSSDDRNLAYVDGAEIHEVGWSMKRDDVLKVADQKRLVGTPEDVADAIEDGGDGPRITYSTFNKVFHEFDGTPNSTFMENVWKFYRERAQESDEFTLFDAYDRFRMGLVYDAMDRGVQQQMTHVIRTATRDGTLGEMFSKSPENIDRDNAKVFFWNARADLSPERVWDEDYGNDLIESKFIVFTPGNQPKKTPHILYDQSLEEGHRWREVYDPASDSTGQRISSYKYADLPQWNLSTATDIYRAMTPTAQNSISTAVEDDQSFATSTDVVDESELDEEGFIVSEEKRKWADKSTQERIKAVGQGNIKWDELEGTDMNPLGLFLRGLTAEDAVAVADRWDLSRRFKTRLSSVSPVNFSPERTDIPSFGAWLSKRMIPDSIGQGDKARQKARYLREMAEAIPGVQSGEAMGTDPTVREETEIYRDLLDHHEDTDYEDYANFYGDEFGESFDDVAYKFASQRPYSADHRALEDMDLDLSDPDPNGDR